MLVLALVLVLVAPVTVHALRRSRFLVPPYSSLNDLGGRQSYSPDACAGAGDGAGAGILEKDNHGAGAGAGILEKDNHIAQARGRVARRAVGYKYINRYNYINIKNR